MLSGFRVALLAAGLATAFVLAGCAGGMGPLSLGISVEKQADGRYCARERVESFANGTSKTYTRLKRCAATEAEARAELEKAERMAQITYPATTQYYQPMSR